METIADRKHRAEEGGAVALPWVERTAAAWLLGYPVGIAPEDHAGDRGGGGGTRAGSPGADA